MLRIEDCVVGAEIVCIDTENVTSLVPKLVKGGIYTIKKVYPGYTIFPFQIIDPCLALEEIEAFLCEGCKQRHDWIYLRAQFKLRNKEELFDIFNVQDNKLPVLEDA